jgi:hypothetical protein
MITYLELRITDGVSVSLAAINVCRLAGDTLNITCNFLYCNHQVHRDFLIIQSNQNVCVHLIITVKKTRKDILNNFNYLA